MRNSLIIFFLFVITGIQAQSLLEDAITLTLCLSDPEELGVDNLFAFSDADSLAELSPAECEAILWKYASTEKNFTKLKSAYRGNPFINESSDAVIYLPNTLQTFFANRTEAVNELSAMKASREIGGGPAPASPGFSVNNIADGLAKFIAKRMKQELSLAFFDRFREALTDHPAIGSLFPQTTSLLELIDKEIYNFDNYLGVLRENFIIDLKTLPGNTEMWFQNKDFIKAEDKRILISDVLEIGQRFVDGTNPIEVINYMANGAQLQQPARLDAIKDSTTRVKFKRLAANMRLVNLISNSIVKDSISGRWYTPKEVIEAFKKPATIYIYLGLMYQERGIVGQLGKKDFGEILTPLAAKTSEANQLVQDLKMEVQQISREGDRIKKAVAQLKEVPWDSVGVEVFYQALQGFFGILEGGIRFQKSFVPGFDKLKVQQEELVEKQFVNLLQNLNELNLNVRRREYVMAVNNLSMLIKMITDKKNPYLTNLIKYSNFMANVAEAESSDEVPSLIEAFALPPGGSRLKKQSKFSVSINTYGGITYGKERLQVGSEVDKSDNDILGFSAPLGVGFNFGLKNNAGSISSYITFIDVGALTAFRLQDSNSDRLPELEWSNIVAPGGHLVYGFWNNIPVSVSIGVQRGPNLRKITDQGSGLQIDASGWRIMASATVDIPLFHLYTK